MQLYHWIPLKNDKITQVKGRVVISPHSAMAYHEGLVMGGLSSVFLVEAKVGVV